MVSALTQAEQLAADARLLDEVRRVVGNDAAIARALGISPSAVSRWGISRPITRGRRSEVERLRADPPELRQALEQVRELYRVKTEHHRVHDWAVLLALLDLPGPGVRARQP